MRPFLSVIMMFLVGNVFADDSKEEAAKENRANNLAKALVQAVQKSYLEKAEWPSKLTEVVSYLENGKKDLVDPWGEEFKFEIVRVKQKDGTEAERPRIWTERKVGDKIKVYGQKPEKDEVVIKRKS